MTSPTVLADEIAAVIAADYDVSEPVTCTFLRHGFNDHFRAHTADGELHIRLYLEGKYYVGGDADLDFELRAAFELADAGCAVARPVPRRDGALLTLAELGGRTRRLAILELAPGDVQSELTVEAAHALGAAVGQLHREADRWSTDEPRYHLDERYLLDQPVALLGELASESTESDVAALATLATEARAILAGLPRDRPSYGLIHADLHLGNIHFVDDTTFAIFDFDHCAFGWRAYDLAPLRMSFDDARWEQALAGYERHAPVPAGVEHIDAFTKMRMLWDIGDILAMRTAWERDEVTEKVRENLPKIIEQVLLGPSARHQ